MASTLESGPEKYVQDLSGVLRREEPRRQDEDVGVVMFSRQLGDLGRPRDRRSHVWMPIRRVGHAESRATQQDASFGVAMRHHVGQRMSEIRVVGGRGRIGPQVLHFVPMLPEPPFELLLHLEAGVVGGDGDYFRHEM